MSAWAECKNGSSINRKDGGDDEAEDGDEALREFFTPNGINEDGSGPDTTKSVLIANLALEAGIAVPTKAEASEDSEDDKAG